MALAGRPRATSSKIFERGGTIAGRHCHPSIGIATHPAAHSMHHGRPTCNHSPHMLALLLGSRGGDGLSGVTGGCVRRKPKSSQIQMRHVNLESTQPELPPEPIKKKQKRSGEMVKNIDFHKKENTVRTPRFKIFFRFRNQKARNLFG